MDSFEQIVSRFFETKGYWTRIGVKVEVSKTEKRKLGKKFMPRPELDIVAFKPATNELLIVECKGFLDSTGVTIKSFLGNNTAFKNRFKFFNNAKLRKLVQTKLAEQFNEEGLLPSKNPKVKYVLAAGNIKAGEQVDLHNYFKGKGWDLYTPEMLAKGLRIFEKRKYENDVVTMVVKLLERNSGTQ